MGMWHRRLMHAPHRLIHACTACIALWHHRPMHAVTAWDLLFWFHLGYTFTSNYFGFKKIQIMDVLLNSTSLFNTNISLNGAAQKMSSEINLATKIMSINRFNIFWTSLYCSKIHFLFNKTKVFVVNWPKWHYKLQHLVCGAIYNQWKCKKHAFPLKSSSFRSS